MSQDTLIAAARAYAARRDGQDLQFTRLAATWLAQECWLDDGNGAPPPDAAALGAGWDGRAAPLVEEIGAAAFLAYFVDAAFAPGPPVRICVSAPFLRALIAQKFTPALKRAYGEFTLEATA